MYHKHKNLKKKGKAFNKHLLTTSDRGLKIRQRKKIAAYRRTKISLTVNVLLENNAREKTVSNIFKTLTDTKTPKLYTP